MAADKTLTNAYAGAPKGWATDNFGLQMMENYVNTAEWPETALSYFLLKCNTFFLNVTDYCFRFLPYK